MYIIEVARDHGNQHSGSITFWEILYVAERISASREGLWCMALAKSDGARSVGEGTVPWSLES
jgi:hypothetical protein